MADNNPYTDAITMVAQSYEYLLKNKKNKQVPKVRGKKVTGMSMLRKALADNNLSLDEFRRT